MKFWNKKKGRDSWIEIIGPSTWYPTYFDEEWERPNAEDAKVWCQQQSSEGRFYRCGRYWFFEKSEDALIFRLKFGV